MTAAATPARLFTNGRIFTSAPGSDGGLEAAMVVRGDVVDFVGNAADAVAAAGDGAEVVDLRGQVVLPGLIDAHTHIMLLGASLTKIDCMGKNIGAVQDAIRQRLIDEPGAKVILGCQFQYDALGAQPHKRYLDAVCPDIPVVIDESSLHSSWLNSAAIAAIGITRDTPDPKGGEFVRDDKGELTGHFKETANIEIVWPWVASLPSPDERIDLLQSVFDAYLSTGVTGAVDMATVADDLTALETYVDRHGRLPMRVACHWLVRPVGDDAGRAAQVREAAAHRHRLAHLAPWLSVAGIKIVSDGVVDACTAYLKEPYVGGELPGPIWPGDELNKVVTLADSLDLQVAVHAIGDAAVDQALDAFEVAIAANGDRPARRHRIEHLEVVTPESIARLARLGVVASLQPVHADPVKVVNWDIQLGHDHRCDRKFPWKEFEDAHSKMAFGSDAPTSPYFPLPNLYTATTRLSAINPALPDPTDARTQALAKLCVSLDSAVRYYTHGSAYSMRADDTLGALEPGKAADFCVLDVDPFGGGLDTLRKAQQGVAETWVAGERVYTKAK